MPIQSPKRAVIFANGVMTDPEATLAAIHPNDLIIAADGGLRHCQELGLTPAVLIGDFDSLDKAELAKMETSGAEIIHHPTRKDFTDLELALQHAHALGVTDIIVVAALGARWDQTLANLLLPAHPGLDDVHIRLVDGTQEIMLVRGGASSSGLEINGRPGDIVSLIPLGGDANGITTHGLEYPLTDGALFFGATRGISNVLLGETASVHLEQGLLLCIVIHNPP